MFISSTIQLNLKNSEIFFSKLRLQWDSNPQSLGFEGMEHLRKRMRKENFFKQSKLLTN